MFNKQDAKVVLDKCLSTGGDFAELYFESTTSNVLGYIDGSVQNAQTNKIYGVAIRILRGYEELYGITSDLSFDGVMKLASDLCNGFDGESLNLEYELKEVNNPDNYKPKHLPSSLTNAKKVSYLKTVCDSAKEYSDEIIQVMCNLTDEEQYITIYNTLGKVVNDVRSHVRISCRVVSKCGDVLNSNGDSIGRNKGYDFFDEVDLKEFGREIAKTSVTMLHADECVGGKYTVVIHNGFGGVLLHEACVHSLEATSVARGASVFCGKVGQKIASDVVNAIDDGTLLEDSWGSLNFDDEGNPTQRNVLIENGILKGYLVDYRNSRIMNHPITGSGRRQSYKFSPTSRMTNTFFAPGNSSFEDIIKNTEYGLFAKSMGGGSVNPASGEFNFAVDEAYLIENGKITKPVKGATLVGSGKDVLLNIDMVSDNLSFGHGMCGSRSGAIPTNVGQPTIRVQNMTVGGRKVK